MEQVIAWAVSAVMGLAFVVKYVKYLAIVGKYVALAGQTVAMVDQVIKAIGDKALTEEEVKAIAASFSAIKVAYKETKAK